MLKILPLTERDRGGFYTYDSGGEHAAKYISDIGAIAAFAENYPDAVSGTIPDDDSEIYRMMYHYGLRTFRRQDRESRVVEDDVAAFVLSQIDKGNEKNLIITAWGDRTGNPNIPTHLLAMAISDRLSSWWEDYIPYPESITLPETQIVGTGEYRMCRVDKEEKMESILRGYRDEARTALVHGLGRLVVFRNGNPEDISQYWEEWKANTHYDFEHPLDVLPVVAALEYLNQDITWPQPK
ncbi:MAG TPA: hypothetical protein PKD19_04265 [Candidatus Saccharibacteria bacterium]|nr:hypothetical protein [Candidatus Saccharibacteria bacterium]HMR38720.1 hypothetical protein [Candidatus Saccharibacteria bacterium]